LFGMTRSPARETINVQLFPIETPQRPAHKNRAGAQTIIYLASSPEAANVTGKYFYKCRPTTPSAPALDDRAALALWERSAVLAM
jgi:hypothetical protein